MKTKYETIFTTSINKNRIIKLEVYDFDASLKFTLTKFERNFLGLDDSIFISLKNTETNSVNSNTNFAIKKDDKEYYEIFKELLLKLGSDQAIISNRAMKKYHKNGYVMSKDENGIFIKNICDSTDFKTVEFTERNKEYPIFKSLVLRLLTQSQIENNSKIKENSLQKKH